MPKDGKVCSRCHTWKTAADYYKTRTGYLPGQCKECRLTTNKERYYDQANDFKTRVLASQRNQRAAMRLEAITAYGGKCECCGLELLPFLTIDHIHGGGKQHQRDANGSLGVLRDLKNKQWPRDIARCLCWNCNCVRSRYGYCPHDGRPELVNPKRTKEPLSDTKQCPVCKQLMSRDCFIGPYCQYCAKTQQRNHRAAIRNGEYLKDPLRGTTRFFKRCSTCNLFKISLLDFNAHKSAADGRQGACKTCFHKDRTAAKDRHCELAQYRKRLLVAEVTEAMGGRCECCGETAPEFLTIDHIHCGGTAERRTPGLKGDIYGRVRREGYPRNKYRLLCYNCNCARRNGICPHQQCGLERDAMAITLTGAGG